MRTVAEFEKETGITIGNPYLHDRKHGLYPSITVLAVGLTPTGRRSRRFLHQTLLRRTGQYLELTAEQAAGACGEFLPETESTGRLHVVRNTHST